MFKYKRAVSGVVVMVMMIALVIAIAGIVFTLTKKTVEEKIKKSEACGLDLLGKLSINSEHVCYDSVNQEIQFSIDREEIDLDKIIVAVETQTKIVQFELKEGIEETFNNLYPFNGQPGDQVKIPAKNSGRTYIGTGFSEEVIGIRIIPVINGEQCDETDSLNEITSC